MTDEQKLEIIRKEPYTVWQDFTAEEKEFLDGALDNPHDAELYHSVWEERPGNLEYTLKHTTCTRAELETTSKTLHKLWENWKEHGGCGGDLKEYTVLDTLELIDRRLKQCT